MRSSPQRSGWITYIVGLLFFVLAFLFTDVIRHADKWSGGHFAHRLALMLPGAIVSGAFCAIATHFLKRRS